MIDPKASPKKSVTFGYNSKGKVIGLGKVTIAKDTSIKDAVLVESLGYNLLSISQLTDVGFYVFLLTMVAKCLGN